MVVNNLPKDLWSPETKDSAVKVVLNCSSFRERKMKFIECGSMARDVSRLNAALDPQTKDGERIDHCVVE